MENAWTGRWVGSDRGRGSARTRVAPCLFVINPVELILSEAQLACLKAAVTIGSEESAALGRGMPFGSKLISPELFAVECTRENADRLLAVARRSCPDTVPEIRAAMEAASQRWTSEPTVSEPVADSTSITLRLNTGRLRRAVELLADYDLDSTYPQVWQTLNAELGRRTLGAPWRSIVVNRRDLSGLPFAVKEILQVGSV